MLQRVSLTDVRQVAVSSLYLEVGSKPSLKGTDPFFRVFPVSSGSSLVDWHLSFNIRFCYL